MAQILIVDDEESLREVLQTLLEREGHDVVSAEDVESALKTAKDWDLDLVYTDLKLPDGDGLEVLKHIRERRTDTQVIVMTAFASTETAVEAMRLGAYDYQLKPFKMDEVRALTAKALEKVALIRENRKLTHEAKSRFGFSAIVGRSPRMLEVIELLEKVGPTKANILVEGESGTGKELVARALHSNSDRREGPFVPVNCGAIPETLIEAELFGHAAGAYTGANKARAGLFEAASGGTLLLDEVGELPLATQVKLLRVLQERVLRRVGEDKERPVDVRIVAATNRDLQEMSAEGTFREDLYYRLNVVRVRVPALRERRPDISLLATTFLRKYADESGKELEGFSAEALSVLERYDFPGNVRELENVVERAVALCGATEIAVDDLPEEVRRRPASQALPAVELPIDGVDLNTLLANMERGYIEAALEHSGGVKTHAAALLGLTFRSFRHRLKKLGIEDGEDGGDESDGPGQ